MDGLDYLLAGSHLFEKSLGFVTSLWLNPEADIRKALTDGDIWIKAVMVVQDGEDHRLFRESEVELRVVIQNIEEFDR